MELTKIGFLETYTLDNNGIMGAILVTDADTKPLEFRVTAPVKPTNFQKTLYGEVLLEHILVELIAVPLIGAVSEKLDLIIVRDPFFLGANNKQGIRIIRLASEKDITPRGKGQELTNSISNNGKMFIETGKNYEQELPQIKELIGSIAAQRNLVEPFERLRLACEQVHQQKTSE